MEFQTAFTLGQLVGENHLDKIAPGDVFHSVVYQDIFHQIVTESPVSAVIDYNLGVTVGLVRTIPKYFVKCILESGKPNE